MLDKIGAAGSLFADIVVLDKISGASSIDAQQLCSTRNILSGPPSSVLAPPLFSSINCLSTYPAITSAQLLVDLEVYYKFNDNILDSGPNALHLTTVGTVPFATGKFGSAADFPGSLTTDHYRRTIDDAALDIGQGLAPWTAGFWIAPDVGSVNGTVVSKGNDSTDGWSIFQQANGSIFWLQHPSLLFFSTAPGAVTFGGPFHYVMVASDGIRTSIYVDNILLVSANSIAVVNSSTPLRVGNRNALNVPIDGKLDELAIWSRHLSSNERGALYNNGNGREL